MSGMAVRERYWWEHYPLHQLWCNNACPLVPRFEYRAGDEYNSNNWSLHWLFFQCWTLEHFAFEVDAAISPHDGIYVGLIVPYLRITVGIRHTWYKWQSKLASLLRRKPALKNINGEYN